MLLIFIKHKDDIKIDNYHAHLAIKICTRYKYTKFLKICKAIRTVILKYFLFKQ